MSHCTMHCTVRSVSESEIHLREGEICDNSYAAKREVDFAELPQPQAEFNPRGTDTDCMVLNIVTYYLSGDASSNEVH